MRKGYLSHRQPTKAQANLHSTVQSLCCSQTYSRDLEEASGKKCRSIAQIGDWAYAFEEPQMEKYKVPFFMCWLK